MFVVAAILALFPLSCHALSKVPKQPRYCDVNQGDCPVSLNGFHVICDEVNFYQASQVCLQNGFQLALANDDTVSDLLNTFSNCTTSPGAEAWIQGVNGYANDPVMYINVLGVVTGGLSNLPVGELPVICQEIGTVTITSVSTTITTTQYGVVTHTIPGFDPAHCSKLPSPPPPCAHCNQPVEKSARQQPPCPWVCPVEIGSLRLVQSADPTVCGFYGWSLADFTTGDTSAINEIVAECVAPLSAQIWIRSYNGVAGTNCTVLNVSGSTSSTSISFVMNGEICADIEADFVLCQDQYLPPAVTASGPLSASANAEFTTTVTTLVITEPSSTRTVTSFGPNPTGRK